MHACTHACMHTVHCEGAAPINLFSSVCTHAHTVCAHRKMCGGLGAGDDILCQLTPKGTKNGLEKVFLGRGALKEIFCSQGYGTRVFMPLRVS